MLPLALVNRLRASHRRLRQMPAYDPYWGRLKLRWAGSRAQRPGRAIAAALLVDLIDEVERLMAQGDSNAVMAASEALDAITRIQRAD